MLDLVTQKSCFYIKDKKEKCSYRNKKSPGFEFLQLVQLANL